jgi:hypothetical protein
MIERARVTGDNNETQHNNHVAKGSTSAGLSRSPLNESPIKQLDRTARVTLRTSNTY